MLLDELSELVGNAMVIVGDGRGVRNRQPKPPTKQGDDRAPIREPANRRHFGEGRPQSRTQDAGSLWRGRRRVEPRIRKAPQAAIVLMRLNRPCIGYRWKCEAALGFRLRP